MIKAVRTISLSTQCQTADFSFSHNFKITEKDLIWVIENHYIFLISRLNGTLQGSTDENR